MKIKLWAIGVLALLLLPANVLAAEFRANENIDIPSSEAVNDDFYAAANNSIVDGTIKGDLFIAGSQLGYDGTTTGSAYFAGSEVTVAGKIDGSLKVGGGIVNIRGTVGKDLFVAGGTVRIEKDAVIKGGVYVAGGAVTIAGTTGLVKAAASELTLTNTAVINGNIKYWSDTELSRESGAVVNGDITFKKVENKQKSYFAEFSAASWIFSLLMLFVVALIMVLVFPKRSTVLIQSWKDKFGYNLLWGLLFAIVAPIAALILLVTVIGIPFGLGLLLIYPIMLYLGKLIGVVALGGWLQNLYNKKGAMAATWASVLLGVIVYGLISLVPVLGPVAKALIVLAGIGVIVSKSWQGIRKSEAK